MIGNEYAVKPSREVSVDENVMVQDIKGQLQKYIPGAAHRSGPPVFDRSSA